MKNRIRDKYVDRYFQYWLIEFNHFKLPSVTSASSYIDVLKSLTIKKSRLERKLYYFYQNVHPMMLMSKHIPDSIKAMDIWVSKHENIKSFKFKWLFIEEKLEKILKKSNSNEIFLELSKNYIQNKSSKNLMTLISRLHESGPPLLKKAIKKFETGLIRGIIKRAGDEIGEQWKAQVLTFYQRNIESYYPANPFGKDVPIDLFFKFFGQKGIFSNFFTENIKPFLNDSAQNEPLKYFERKINSFNPVLNRLLHLSQKFSIHNKEMKFNFLIHPILMSQGYKKVQLMIDDININYEYGPDHGFLYQWPSNANDKKIIFVCKDFSGNYLKTVITGPWAIFRLLEKSNVNLNKRCIDHFFKVYTGHCMLKLKVTISEPLSMNYR